jgi:hypothetical protein
MHYNASHNDTECGTMSAKDRALWLAIRRALIIILGAIEDHINMERTKQPNHEKRKKAV